MCLRHYHQRSRDCLTAECSCFYVRPRNDWGPGGFLGLEVVSRLQKLEVVIRCKWSVELVKSSLARFPCFTSLRWGFYLSSTKIIKPETSAMKDLHCVPVLTPDMSGVHHNPRLQAVNFHCTVNIHNGLYTTLWPDHKLLHSLHLCELGLYKQSTLLPDVRHAGIFVNWPICLESRKSEWILVMKRKRNPLDVLQVPDSFVATNRCLEHSRHYLLSTAVEFNSPILAPGWINSVNHLQRLLQTWSHSFMLIQVKHVL